VKIISFWDIAPCSVFEVDRRFSGAYYLHPVMMNHLEDLGLNGKLTLKLINMAKGVDWANLVQDGDWWQIPVNTVMNLRVP
jgi:hypothetical protein